jgi:hypothetical protein
MHKLGMLGASIFLTMAVPASAQDLKDEIQNVTLHTNNTSISRMQQELLHSIQQNI